MNVNISYRLGIGIVLATVLAAGAVSPLASRASLRALTAPAGEGPDLGFRLGDFRLQERSGRVVTQADLADEVWVASFIFTRCPASCPRITAVMKGLQDPLMKSHVRLVSLSVDPEFDTPAVLTEYARGFGADRDGWWFLTGTESEIYDLILSRFKISIQKNERSSPRGDAEAVSHSDRLVLVDRGNVVSGIFDSNDPRALERLKVRARKLASWARPLPAVNAGLNGTCAILLMVGWSLIMTRRVRGHAACMIAAVVVSTVFLGCYLAYHFEAGSVPFRGDGSSRWIYFTILISHTLLATFGVVPLVSLTLIRAIRSDFTRHAAIARVTFPIWLYVSITGVIIYLMLYQMPVSPQV